MHTIVSPQFPTAQEEERTSRGSALRKIGSPPQIRCCGLVPLLLPLSWQLPHGFPSHPGDQQASGAPPGVDPYKLSQLDAGIPTHCLWGGIFL